MRYLKERFDRFHDDNPGVMVIFIRFTDELRKAGMVKISAYEVLHRVRWELLILGGNYNLVDSLKTVYGNLYAIELMAQDANYREFFDLTDDHGY